MPSKFSCHANMQNVRTTTENVIIEERSRLCKGCSVIDNNCDLGNSFTKSEYKI